jgi:hypothetical protein
LPSDVGDRDRRTEVTRPVTYVEINSPDLERSSTFFAAAFDWTLRPFADPEYLVADSGTVQAWTPASWRRGTGSREPSRSPG